MKRQVLLAAMVAALAIPIGFAQAQDAAAPAAAAAPITPEEYILKASLANLFEIQAAQLALEKSTSDDVKKIAEQLVTDHTKSNEALGKAVVKEKIEVTLPTELDAEHKALLDSLTAASPEEFDEVFIEVQMKVHENAVALHTLYGKSGDNKGLQTFAKSVRPTVKWHFDMIEKIPEA